jgi:hypothetical protein
VTTAEIVIVVVVGVVVLIGLALVVAMATRRRGRRQLQQQFGPEYDRTMTATGDEKRADAQLRDRMDERERLQLRPLSRVDRDAFSQEWRGIQGRFVDAPDDSLVQADGLLTRVMSESGYPVEDFDRQADLISVDHADLVGNYRMARVVRDASLQGSIETEQERQALLAYRALFAELLDEPNSDTAEREIHSNTPSERPRA